MLTTSGETLGQEALLAVVMQDTSEQGTASITVLSWLWDRIGGWGEEFVLHDFEDLFLRIQALGKVGFLVDEAAAGVHLGGQTPA